MFFSSVLFTKRGNLAKVWLAAHHQDKRLTKTIVVSTNIEECSQELSEPTVPLSLRIAGQLLLGVVRIYQRKVRYLQEDTQEALTKVRMTSRPGSGALELHPSHATATTSHITFVDAAENDFLDFAIPDIPLSRLEEICDDAYAQQELVRAHDITLDDDDRFSYNLSLNQGVKQFDDVHDVLIGGEEEDIIQIEPLEPAAGEPLDDAVDQSVEVGRDAQDFDLDYTLPAIDIKYDEPVKDGGVESLAPVEDLAEAPIPLVDMHDLASQTGNDHSVLGSVDLAQDLTGEINVAVKKSRKRKRAQRDRSTQLSTSEVMGESTSELVAEKIDLLVEPEPNFSASSPGDLPDALLMPSEEALGPLADDLTALIASSLRKGTTGAAADAVGPAELPEDRSVSEPAAAGAEDDMVEVAEDADESRRHLDDEPAPFCDDDMPIPDQDDHHPAPDADDDQRKFEESFISAAPLEEPLPDLVGEEDQRDDDASQSAAFSTWSDRTKQMCVLLSERLDASDDAGLTLQSLIAGKSRATAAIVFLETLILKTHDFIDLDQQQPYGDIEIKRASRFRDGRSMADMVAITG